MKAIDEFGSVLAMAALILGACAAADGLLFASDAGIATPDHASAGYRRANFIAVVHQDRVVLGDYGRAGPAGAQASAEADDGAPLAPTALPQQTRLSW
jgi:hypothetical protein